MVTGSLPPLPLLLVPSFLRLPPPPRCLRLPPAMVCERTQRLKDDQIYSRQLIFTVSGCPEVCGHRQSVGIGTRHEGADKNDEGC